jgi:hypothetical protein
MTAKSSATGTNTNATKGKGFWPLLFVLLGSFRREFQHKTSTILAERVVPRNSENRRRLRDSPSAEFY